MSIQCNVEGELFGTHFKLAPDPYQTSDGTPQGRHGMASLSPQNANQLFGYAHLNMLEIIKKTSRGFWLGQNCIVPPEFQVYISNHLCSLVPRLVVPM